LNEHLLTINCCKDNHMQGHISSGFRFRFTASSLMCPTLTSCSHPPTLPFSQPPRRFLQHHTHTHTYMQDYFSSGCRSHLQRLLIDVPSARSVSCTRLLRRTLEFPAVNSAFTGGAYRHAYLASDAVDHEVAWAPAQVTKARAWPSHTLLCSG
jgi:hypothetical protein